MQVVSISQKLASATVGIAGLGGLGSNVASLLARAGVGRLIIADFDYVEPENLTRQQYFTDQTGKSKVDCTTENLHRINPQVQVVGHKLRLARENVVAVFAGADVIAECLDEAGQKKMLVETVLTQTVEPVVVTAVGLAGYGDSNSIVTRRISERLIMVGDGRSGIDSGAILCAPRVALAAAHQANAIVEVIIDGKG